MKKLQIINEALFENFHKNEVFDELKGIKLSEEQAFNFSLQDEEAEFDELVAKYGQENILEPNEVYEGYCLLCNETYNEVVKMRGSIEQLDDDDEITNIAINNRKIYKLCYDEVDEIKSSKDKEATGYAKVLFTFGTQIFEFLGTPEVAGSARKKLIEGALKGSTIELTDEENKVVEGCLGKFYYNALFKKVD